MNMIFKMLKTMILRDSSIMMIIKVGIKDSIKVSSNQNKFI